ncbi:MAG: hypothetical protein TREMPRED_002133 [Tremellales sp. Tagirdzhanova-0007]|nr:MAG: hypothetical protein TREMPRED_002133 [Tremellales sp. Tagirdzhanova-0007]
MPRCVSDSSAPQSLDIVVERESSSMPEDTSFSKSEDTSFAKSTYSWATQFSGETHELRTAAHYVSPVGPTDEEEELLDSLVKLDRRRKRIVAIAHTVRQLEGVGSREKEDPAYFDVIAKAWFERPQNTRESIIGLHGLPPALNSPPTPAHPNEGGLHSPNSANDSKALHDFAALGGYPPRLGLASSMSSPVDIEFRTPLMEELPLHEHNDYSQRSKSLRYSYASTLHDLALDGGFEQGSKLMNDKAWLRMSKSGAPWGGAFNTLSSEPPTTSRQSSTLDTPRPPVTLDTAIVLQRDPPERTLRKYSTNISDLRPPAKLENFAGPSKGWGLGFSSWWDTDSPAIAHVEPGFRMGEDGTERKSIDLDEESSTGYLSSSHSRRQSSIRSITSSPTLNQELEEDQAGSGDTLETSSSRSHIKPALPRSAKNQDPTMRTILDQTMRTSQHPDYDRSSSPVSWRDTPIPVELELGDGIVKDLHVLLLPTSGIKETQPLSLFAETVVAKHELAFVTQPYVSSKSSPQTSSRISITIFFLGFFLPFLWIYGGWFIAQPAVEFDVEGGGVAISDSKWISWAESSDRWVKRCRWAAAIGLPVFVIAGIMAIVVCFVCR